jgi:hypothetical protein
MKIRSGFVSNSSSSSFICNVCGTVESGRDMSAKDFEMTECVNGHTFCNSHFVGEELTPEIMKALLINDISKKPLASYYTEESKKSDLEEIAGLEEDELEEYFNDHFYECDPSRCPICTFQNVDSEDGFNFLKKKFSLNNEDVLGFVRSQFKDYKEFSEFLKPKKV